MKRTRKFLTDTHTHTQRKDENITPPWHTLYAGGIIRETKYEQISSCLCNIMSGSLHNCFGISLLALIWNLIHQIKILTLFS